MCCFNVVSLCISLVTHFASAAFVLMVLCEGLYLVSHNLFLYYTSSVFNSVMASSVDGFGPFQAGAETIGPWSDPMSRGAKPYVLSGY